MDWNDDELYMWEEFVRIKKTAADTDWYAKSTSLDEPLSKLFLSTDQLSTDVIWFILKKAVNLGMEKQETR